MKILALFENESQGSLESKHGLSLYIKTENHNILFDVGPDKTLFKNALLKGIDLTKIDTVILSHGHIDHGGALSSFIKMNSHAKIYIQRKAFESHFYKLSCFKFNVGIDKNLIKHSQIMLLDGSMKIDDELELFTVNQRDKSYSKANDRLYQNTEKDEFTHEQNLIVRENKIVLFMGCGHCGVVNIMNHEKSKHFDYCIGGYHLYDPVMKNAVSESTLDEIANELNNYPQTKFYTCHCTGTKAFDYLVKKMNHLFYLCCGDEIIT